jgi:hypothetical protein
LPNLKYYARIPYSPWIEYYLLATPFEGDSIKFGTETMTGTDLEPSRLTRFNPGSGYLAAGAAGVVALITAALINGSSPSKDASEKRGNSPLPCIAPSVAVGGGIAAVVYWKNRHKRYKETPTRRASH